ncbi:MAG: hypothetical protein IJM83_09565 [Firmicutes bacterium]|nr:hypothetical protein [Bacillota bacterium]
MDLIKSKDSRYDEYESLLLERDQIKKEAGQIWTVYTATFGQLIADVYEEKLECIKCKKTISFYQTALNHGGIVDADALQKYLEKEMAAYYANLKRMMEDHDRCKKAGHSTDYDVRRSKELYRRLAKLLHPDINSETDRQEVLRELWQRVLTAYAHNDVKELSELEVLIRKALKDLGVGEIKVDIPDIEEKIEALKAEIAEIMSTEPYTYRELLDDEEAIEKKKKQLTEELQSYQKYRKELDEMIQKMLESGEVRIKWLMN